MKCLLHIIILLSLGGALISCAQHRDLSVNTTAMPNVDIQRYMGRWYEIARFPNQYEKGMDRVIATYQLTKGGRIYIKNVGFEENGKFAYAHGQGYIPNPAVGGHLRVSFVFPYRWFYGDYNILYVNKDYSLALVSGSDSEYLWILARTPQITEREKQDILGIARARGFDTSRLIWPRPADLGKLDRIEWPTTHGCF